MAFGPGPMNFFLSSYLEAKLAANKAPRLVYLTNPLAESPLTSSPGS